MEKNAYVGQNAYSATIRVSVVETVHYNIVFGEIKSNSWARVSLRLTDECKADAAAMRKSKGRLAIEYLVRPVAPFSTIGMDSKAPTLSSPIRENIENMYIRADLIAARLKYDKTNNYLDCGLIVVHEKG